MEAAEQQRLTPQINYQYTFTVFTPTYNRAYTLHRVYESLKKQTYRDFEWLIIDDGSTDRTCELVEQWQKEAELNICYIYQENQGKYIAWNHGVQEAKGELFLCLDSDDECVPDALERLKYHWDSILEKQQNKTSSVVCLCRYRHGDLIGTKFPKNVTYSDYLEMQYKFKVKGDKWIVDKTEVLRNFPLPVVKGTKTVGIGLVGNILARNNFKLRFVNEALLIKEYLPDGISLCTDCSKHAVGAAFLHANSLNEDLEWFWYAPLTFLRWAVHYSRFSFHAGTSIIDQLKKLNTTLGKVLWLLALPLGYLLYIKDRFFKESYEQHL